MDSIKNTEQCYIRQRELTFGLLRLMYEIPYEKISVIDICNHVSVSRKTFYRYFSSKNEALDMLVDFVLYDIGAYPSSEEFDSEQAYTSEMMRFFYYWNDYRQILNTLLSNSLIETLCFRAASISLSEMSVFKNKLGHLDSMVQESIAAYYVGGLMTMLVFWAKNGYKDPPEQMAARLLQLTYSPKSIEHSNIAQKTTE